NNCRDLVDIAGTFNAVEIIFGNSGRPVPGTEKALDFLDGRAWDQAWAWGGPRIRLSAKRGWRGLAKGAGPGVAGIVRWIRSRERSPGSERSQPWSSAVNAGSWEMAAAPDEATDENPCSRTCCW